MSPCVASWRQRNDLRHSRLRLAVLRLAVSFVGVACSPVSPATPPHLHSVPSAQGYLAAATLADITPPLHLSLFGHGPEGRIAVGVRLRLNCQVFLIATRGDVVALVPCDLQAPSMALQREVITRLERSGVPITADRLFIMATHTHAAPGHYFEARRYSGPFSSQAPGYDPLVLDFLAGRIAGAVADAFAVLKPACIGWNQTNVWGLTFNRSYVPFLANGPSGDREDPAAVAGRAEQRLKEAEWKTTPGGNADEPSTIELIDGAGSDAPPTEAERGASGAEEAIDPALSVLGLYRRAGDAPSCDGAQLMGVLAVYGMHPTGAPNTNDLYNGDIFGFAVRVAEGRLTPPSAVGPELEKLAASRKEESADAGSAHVIVGLANGIEGDVSPKMNFQSMPEARKRGRTLGLAIAKATSDIGGDLSADGELAHLSWDLAFPGGQYDSDPTHRLCDDAELGMASAGGARDGPTRVRIVPAANAGFQPNRLSYCHDQKVPLRRGAPTGDYDFPRVGPIALLQVGDGILATLPGEATTMTGSRIRGAIAAQLGSRPQHLALVGLTNQYFQYFATHEEYPFQFYEGASTLYGPHTEQFLVRHFGCLAARLGHRPDECNAAGAINRPAALDACPSPLARRWPIDEAVEALGLDPLDVYPVRRDGALGWEMLIDALPLAFTSDRSLFSVAVLLGDSGSVEVDDDRGASIEVRELDDERWRIRWIPDLRTGDARCGPRFRLAVRGQVSFTSRSFALGCPGDPGAEVPGAEVP